MRAEHAKMSRASTDRQLTLFRDADVPAAQADEEEGVRWRGVRLKPEAFDHLGLPVAVQHGVVDCVAVSVGAGVGEGLILRIEIEGVDVELSDVSDEDPARQLVVERSQRQARLRSDTHARLSRLLGSSSAGSVLSHRVLSHLLGQVRLPFPPDNRQSERLIEADGEMCILCVVSFSFTSRYPSARSICVYARQRVSWVSRVNLPH